MAQSVTAIPIDVPEQHYTGKQLLQILKEIKAATGDLQLIAQAQLVMLVRPDEAVLNAPPTEAERIAAHHAYRLAWIEVVQVKRDHVFRLLGKDAETLQRVICPTVDDLSI